MQLFPRTECGGAVHQAFLNAAISTLSFVQKVLVRIIVLIFKVKTMEICAVTPVFCWKGLQIMDADGCI